MHEPGRSKCISHYTGVSLDWKNRRKRVIIMARLNNNCHVNAADVRYDSKACCWVDDSGHYYDIEDWQNGVIRK